MSRFALIVAPLILCGVCACSGDDDNEEAGGSSLSFFVTSTTHDGNLGGLTGADQACQTLAQAAGAGSKTWHAYLSAQNGTTPVNARDRIGAGPWYNSLGMKVADDVASLHALTGNADLFITEKKEKVNGQWNAAAVNEHDVMTGSGSDGRLLVGDMQSTCSDWTSNTLTPGPQVGHTDGMGPMMATDQARYTSWNGGHPARGCSTADLAPSGSTGRIYCFATN